MGQQKDNFEQMLQEKQEKLHSLREALDLLKDEIADKQYAIQEVQTLQMKEVSSLKT
jgi:ATP-dependent protease HslVU (ClpYQ) peptidase subunit